MPVFFIYDAAKTPLSVKSQIRAPIAGVSLYEIKKPIKVNASHKKHVSFVGYGNSLINP